MEAEGHRTRARWLHPLAALAPWRNGSWTATARLQLRAAKENAAGRVAFGVVGKAYRTTAHRRGRLEAGKPQDQRIFGCAWQTESQKVRVDRGSRREHQSGTRQPQY